MTQVKELERLIKMRDAKLISEKEYEVLKEALLEENDNISNGNKDDFLSEWEDAIAENKQKHTASKKKKIDDIKTEKINENIGIKEAEEQTNIEIDGGEDRNTDNSYSSNTEHQKFPVGVICYLIIVILITFGLPFLLLKYQTSSKTESTYSSNRVSSNYYSPSTTNYNSSSMAYNIQKNAVCEREMAKAEREYIICMNQAQRSYGTKYGINPQMNPTWATQRQIVQGNCEYVYNHKRQTLRAAGWCR